ncbi:MAG: hypothetical protein ACT4NV_02985 [Rhodoferax sp.]
MAQIAVHLAPTLAIRLTLGSTSGTGVQLTPQTPVVRLSSQAPVVLAALGEVLRGPKGDTGPQGPKGDTSDLAADPLAYYILARA